MSALQQSGARPVAVYGLHGAKFDVLLFCGKSLLRVTLRMSRLVSVLNTEQAMIIDTQTDSLDTSWHWADSSMCQTYGQQPVNAFSETL